VKTSSVAIIPNEELVSVIITTRNNQDTLNACLKSIRDQDYPSIELLVIDNNSTDETKKIAKKYADKVFNKGPERSAQRNFGVKQCQGKYVLIIDSDMELPNSVVNECMQAVNDSTQAIIIPEISFGEGFWAECKSLERSFYNGVDWIEAPRFFSKNMYLKADGYDEKMSGGEDWDLSNRIRPLTSISHTLVPIRHNEGRPTLKSIINKRRYYAKGFNHMYDKTKFYKNSTKSPSRQALCIYKLFFTHPKELLKKPSIGVGMITMKSLEFAVMASGRYTRKGFRARA
jgi:glycosyltransferase involved in cell wall biosynthesis